MKYCTVCFVPCVLSLIKMSRFMYGPWTSTRLMWVYYLKSRYQRLVLTRNFDDIYIVKCMSDVITNQTNPCRKHTPYQILYCVCFLHRPGLPERTLGAEYFGLHSHTGIHKFCWYCSNTYLHGAFLSFLTTPIVFLLHMTKLY